MHRTHFLLWQSDLRDSDSCSHLGGKSFELHYIAVYYTLGYQKFLHGLGVQEVTS